MQLAYPSNHIVACKVELPAPNLEVMPKLLWGQAAGLFTPAYWAAECHLSEATCGQEASRRLGKTLIEEIAVCVLGGFGMPAEVGLAAFARMREERLLLEGTTAVTIENALLRPLWIGRRNVRYRYPRQKANYLAGILDRVYQSTPPSDPLDLREYLRTLPGIGPKTASWIVRNWTNSDDVAILDVHILRALRHLKLIEKVSLPRDYVDTEQVFISLARGMRVRASTLDVVMWEHMRRWGYLMADRATAHSPREIPKRPLTSQLFFPETAAVD